MIPAEVPALFLEWIPFSEGILNFQGYSLFWTARFQPPTRFFGNFDSNESMSLLRTTCRVDGGVSPEIPDLAALGYPPRQDERGQITVGGWRVGVGGGMLTFHVTCSRCWCYATQGLGWGGVNVPCDLLTLLMLRHAGVGVGGMSTFHVTCSRCWWYATQGLGWGGGWC